MNNTLAGLASSLLLNVGLTRAAEKLDPMQNRAEKPVVFVASSEPCITACNFMPESGL